MHACINTAFHPTKLGVCTPIKASWTPLYAQPSRRPGQPNVRWLVCEYVLMLSSMALQVIQCCACVRRLGRLSSLCFSNLVTIKAIFMHACMKHAPNLHLHLWHTRPSKPNLSPPNLVYALTQRRPGRSHMHSSCAGPVRPV